MLWQDKPSEAVVGLLGKGVLAIWNGIDPEADSDFVSWHVNEHIPERVGVPGFLRGRRYVALDGHPKYFNFYETVSADVLNSAAYLERLNDPSPWTRRVIRHFKDTSRTVCSVVDSTGSGDGGVIATIKLGDISGPKNLEVLGRIVSRFNEMPTIVAVHLLEGQGSGGSGNTTEKRLRKEKDQTEAWILLVEAVDVEALTLVVSDPLLKSLLDLPGSEFGSLGAVGIYQLQYSLSRNQNS